MKIERFCEASSLSSVAGPDERTHMVYLGCERFVLSSRMSQSWNVRVGLRINPTDAKEHGQEDKARWWQMCWSVKDAREALVGEHGTFNCVANNLVVVL